MKPAGDSAAVAIQYSYLPSWASFLVDQEKAEEAGRALFDAVYHKWSVMPVDQRPRLYVFGLSLGSYAAEAPFSGEADLANRTDGVLLAGPPAFNPLNREFTGDRDPGTPEVQPVFRNGRTVRFANDPASGMPPVDQEWTGSRVLYLQHASDPIVWLSPDLILHRPDWLAEPPGPRCDRRDDLDTVCHLLAGDHGHARAGGHPTRAWTLLHPGVRGRLGRTARPARLDHAKGRHPEGHRRPIALTAPGSPKPEKRRLGQDITLGDRRLRWTQNFAVLAVHIGVDFGVAFMAVVVGGVLALIGLTIR